MKQHDSQKFCIGTMKRMQLSYGERKILSFTMGIRAYLHERILLQISSDVCRQTIIQKVVFSIVGTSHKIGKEKVCTNLLEVLMEVS